MSKIDQAFIHAYAPEKSASVPFAPPAAPQVVQPRFDVATGNSSADAIDPPHFVTAQVRDARAQVAALQQDSVQHQNANHSATPRVDNPTSQRRPLSSFSAQEPTIDRSFRPVFEVDAFRWPQVTTDLLQQHSQLLIPVAEQLLDVSEEGRSLIGIAGTRQAVGATTILLSLARLLATTEKSIALVDADFSHHSLASDLGLQIDSGWEDVLTGKVPLAEGVIHSLNENTSILPLVGRSIPALDLLSSIQTSVSAGVLRYHYDIVIFDLGTAARQPQWDFAQKVMEHCRIDTSIIVADSQHTRHTADQDVDQLLALLGSSCLGLIGNDAIS